MSYRSTGPLWSHVPLAGQVGSSNCVPFPAVRMPAQLLKPRPVGSDLGPTWPSLFTPPDAEKFHWGAPDVPRFVKIWITPPDAWVPYSVVAAAPFTISM